MMNGIGADEVIVETPRHDRSLHELETSEVEDVMRTWVARIMDLERDKRIRYVLIFKNHGEEAGARTITHSISQLMALPVTPRVIKAKLVAARDYYSLKERCIYCDVLLRELTGRKRLVAENDDFVALAPFASRSPFELGILPKLHSSAFTQMRPGQFQSLARLLRDVLLRLNPPVNQAENLVWPLTRSRFPRSCTPQSGDPSINRDTTQQFEVIKELCGAEYHGAQRIVGNAHRQRGFFADPLVKIL